MAIKNILNKEIKIKTKSPDYLAFDFGNKDIRIVLGNFFNNRLILKKFYTVEFEKEIYNNGKILEFDTIVRTMTKFLKSNNIKVKNSIFTLNTTEALTRTFDIPYIENDEEQNSAIEYEIMDKFPGDLSDYAIDFRILDCDESMCNVFSCTLPKHLVDEKVRLFKEMGLKLKFIDLTPNAISKLISFTINSSEVKEYDREEKVGQTIALVDITSSVLSVNIYKNGKLEFQRSVTNDFYNAYPDIFTIPENNVERYIDLNENEQYREAFNKNVADIEKCFKFYTSRGIGNVIDEIFLYGYKIAIKDLNNAIVSALGAKAKRVTRLNEVVEIKAKDYQNRNIGLYLNSIASLIRLD